MAIVRALTVFAPTTSGGEDPDLGELGKAAERVSAALSARGLEPWTTRIVLPPLEGCSRECGRRVEEAGGLREVLVHAVSVDGWRRGLVGEVLEAISGAENVFASIRCSTLSCLEGVLGEEWGLAKRFEPDVFTRLAVVVGEWVETPYFPATTSLRAGGPGFGLALRYVDLFRRAVHGDPEELRGFVKRVVGAGLGASEEAGIVFLGVDLSLSPWMEESVAEVLGELAGAELGGLGSLAAVYEANSMIQRLAEETGAPTIGFNEVMLAVAEDTVLDDLVARGRVRLRDLVAYSAFCVAGVDMVAVPVGQVNPKHLAMDVYAAARRKRRSYGVRLIPVDAEPEQTITLKRFGRTRVVNP